MKRMQSVPEIYLFRESVDFRKSINGLLVIIESDTDLPLGSGALFLFTNKQRDKIDASMCANCGVEKSIWQVSVNG